MSKRFFSSDFHLNSALINRYAHRPWQDAETASNALVENVNRNLSRTDVLFHVGDFILDSVDRHGAEEDVPLDRSLDYWLSRMNCRTVFLAGNHDDGHSFSADAKSMIIDLSKEYRNVYVNHFPSDSGFYHGLKGDSRHVQVNLCGHVHDAWAVKYDALKQVLNVNVGVDAWGYKPVSDEEIIKLLNLIFDVENTGVRPDFSRGWTWSTADILKFRSGRASILEKRREARTLERYARKGLTPEECERRRIEGMKRSAEKKALYSGSKTA